MGFMNFVFVFLIPGTTLLRWKFVVLLTPTPRWLKTIVQAIRSAQNAGSWSATGTISFQLQVVFVCPFLSMSLSMKHYNGLLHNSTELLMWDQSGVHSVTKKPMLILLVLVHQRMLFSMVPICQLWLDQALEVLHLMNMEWPNTRTGLL